MTDAQNAHEDDGPHEGPIKTSRQLIVTIIFAFLVPIVGIVLLVWYVTAAMRPAAGTDALTSAQAIEQRIRPVAMVEIRDATDAASLRSGEQVYQAQCSACHGSGALGAPKFGDAASWSGRLASGLEKLAHAAIAGKGQMPPQGGGDYSDYEITRAVVHMANAAGGSFTEPPAPAASSAASGAATAAAGATAPGGAATMAAAPGAATSTPPAATATAAAPATAGPPALYTSACSVCHTAGIAGAPKTGDKAAWAPRIAQGEATLVQHAIKGIGAMPPKGGATNASDADIKAVVGYMIAAAR